MRLIDADKLEPSEAYMDGFTRIVYMDDIDEMPTIDAQPVRHGHWRSINMLMECCSVCKGVSLDKTEYCPNCGAKMDGAE